MWQQEGQGPRQLPGGKACTAAPASTEPCARRSRQGLGPACRGRTHAPGAGASAPALLQPCLPTACVHSPLAQALLGQRQPTGPFTAAPIVTRPLGCHRPQSASQTRPARHPQPSSGNSSWPWAPKDPKDKKCRPTTMEQIHSPLLWMQGAYWDVPPCPKVWLTLQSSLTAWCFF